MTKILKSIFHFSVLFLIIISLWPGSLLGFLFYDDWGQQPDLIENPFGTTINHFIYYVYASLLGFFLYRENENFKKLVYGLFFLSITLELFQLIIPNVHQTYNCRGAYVAGTLLTVQVLDKNTLWSAG